ncbi:MAG: DNA-binding NarL/FixJ family response regulator [Porticoccaceae bacterium]|jgi:DNA-binding NarL/FixJ family response regulator
MNRTPALKVLIASSHADTRVAISWMLRQSFPDAIVTKAEAVAEARQIASAELPGCVLIDASLPDFAAELTGFADSLQQQRIPLIVIHDGQDTPTDSDGISASLHRTSLDVTTIELAVSRATRLAEMSRRIEDLEEELRTTNEDLAATRASAAAANETRKTVEAAGTANAAPAQPDRSPVGQPPDVNTPDVQTAAKSLERPRLVTSGLEVSTEDERELAARVQKDLMPPGSPLIEGFDIAGLSIHAETTGGDYYDYLPMADDLLCISIGECSGRGLAPAMFMASLRAYLRVLASSTTDISDILSQVNTLITEDIGDEEFIVTLMLFQIDDRTRTLRYASAGHQAFFIDRDGNVDILHSTGMPLGLRDETVILEGEPRKIRTGEILLLASDGVQKMTSDSGEQFGTDRMLNLVKENRNLPSRIIASYLRKACTEFASSEFQHDDVTIVIVKGDDS